MGPDGAGSARVSRPSSSLRDGDVIELKYRGNTAKLPVTIVPGHPDGAVTAFFGYGRAGHRARRHVGRRRSRRTSTSIACAPSDALWFGGGLEIAKTGDRFVIARTQEHHMMEKRNRCASPPPRKYHKDPEVIGHMVHKVPEDDDADSRMGIQGPQVGDVDRPDLLHRLRRLHDRLRRREQHPGRRQGPGPARPRDALDPRRPLLRGHARGPELDRDRSPAGALHAVRKRALRAGLPGRRHDAQLRRPERHGLQPLRRHPLLLEQLPVQGPPLQLPALPGLDDAEPRADAQSRRHRAEPRRHGEVHLLRAAHQLRARRRRSATIGRSRTARSSRPAPRPARRRRSCSAT